jgi:hypothetical protein
MIMISYRRADAPDVAGRISDHLVAKYGEKNVFFDFNSIPTGANYRKRIEKAIVNSDVILAVIGLHWLGKNPDGKPSRMDDAADNVRVELETAMKHHKPILPLLVNGALMPAESELPEPLRELSSYNAAKVDSGQDFRLHMGRLVESIEDALKDTEGQPAPAHFTGLHRLWPYGAGALTMAAALGILVLSGVVPFESSETTASIADHRAVPADPVTGAIPAAVTARATARGGFIFADSDKRLLSDDDLKDLSKDELRIARNEIFARRGRFFVDARLAVYFSQFSWYHPSKVDVDIELNKTESTNVSAIQVAESRK